jgi:hypothetical protein
MNSARMRHFTILIGNETRGPLTEESLMAMIADGTVNADTRCAPVGATEWVPLSAHFNFGSKLKVNLGKQVSTEAEQAAATTRIDPDLRKKLLIYGLADSATVDSFTQVQAATAVRAKERLLSSQIRSHRIAKAAAFMVAVPLAFAAGLFAPFIPAALGLIVSSAIHEEGAAKAALAGCHQEIKQMRVSVRKIEAIAFDPPLGGSLVGDAMANRLRIAPEKSFVLKGRFGSEQLSKNFSLNGSPLRREGRRVHLLKEMPSGTLLELLDKSEESLRNPIGTGENDWPAFDRSKGKELEKLVRSATLATTPAHPQGHFSLEFIPPINESMARQLVIEIPARGSKLFATYSSRVLEQVEWLAEPLPQSQYIAREEYQVTKKIAVGGKKLTATITTPYRRFIISRTSPTWHYVAVARKEDKDVLHVLVSEPQFNSTHEGQLFDHAKYATLRCFTEPVESQNPPGLVVP